MPLIPKPNYNQIFASQAPEQDKPAVFNNYPEGWGPESRPNNGKPTIKGFNYLQQTSDLKDLWILQNGACLPYDESIEYAEGAPVLKDGVIQYKTAGGFKSRDSVSIPTYNNAADGVDPVTGVANSAYFNVRSTDEDTMLVEYQNVGGSAVETGKRYLSELGVRLQEKPASTIIDASGKDQQNFNDSFQLLKKQLISVLDHGAKGDGINDDTIPIRNAITNAKENNGIVWFPSVTSEYQDGATPSRGYLTTDQIVFPTKLHVKMDSPIIYDGPSTAPALVYGTALPLNKSQFSEFVNVDVWVYNRNTAAWGNDNNIGVWMYPHQFCGINLKVVQGFECGVVLNGDKQGFVYNHIFVDELRGNRIGMKWLATNMGWVNENTFYKGRIASGPTPAGKEASNRYGVIGTTDNFSIENNHWLNPCFELGHNTETVESVPIVLHNSSNNTFNNIRAENHKKWIARYTGTSSTNLITSDYGRLDSTVPLANMGSDWLAVDDQTTYKNNLFINRKYDDLFYRPFSKIRVDNFRDRFYGLDGGFGAVSGLASITSDAYPSVPTYSRGAYGDTVNADGALSFGSASVRRVIRIKTNGAKKIVVKQSGSITGLTVKTFDTSKNLLYSTTTQYAKELNVNGGGGNAIATFGGSYALNTPLHGVSVIGLHADVAYIDLLIGGSGASIYSVEVSTTDSVQLEQIPFFSKKAHSVKPTLTTNVDEFTVVYNSAFTGTGAYGWILAGGAWRDLT